MRYLLLIGLLFGCSYDSGLRGNCVSRAFYQASSRVLQKNQEVRFIVSHIHKGVDHIQVQFKEDGEWKYSSQQGSVILEGQKHFAANPYKYLTWKELMSELKEKF